MARTTSTKVLNPAVPFVDNITVSETRTTDVNGTRTRAIEVVTNVEVADVPVLPTFIWETH